MIIQCMIKRDGVTEVARGGKHYRFIKNEHGDEVCDIHDTAHAKMFLRMGDRYYRKYGAVVETDLDDDTTVAEIDEDTFDEFVPITEGKDESKVAVLPPADEEVEDFVEEQTPIQDEEQVLGSMIEAGDSLAVIGKAMGVSKSTAANRVKAYKEANGLA